MRLLLSAVLLAALTALSFADTLLGLQVNVKDGGGAEDFKAMLLEQKRIGTDGCVMSTKWSDLEPTPGAINVEKFGSDLAGSAAFGWKVALTIQTIDTVKRTVPEDLQNEPWDSPKMRRRFDALLKAVAAKFGNQMVSVSLGNEVDGYLGDHKDQISAYKAFLAASRKTLREIHPNLPVGVTCMYEGWRSNHALIENLFGGLDVVYFTYYPMHDVMQVRPPSTAGPDLDSMIKIAAGRPLVLQEIGYPASPLNDSSEAKQAEFVKAFYAELTKRRKSVTLAAYFLQTDFAPKLVDTLTGYYGVDHPNFKAFLSTLGLRRSDGSERPALAAFAKAVADFHKN